MDCHFCLLLLLLFILPWLPIIRTRLSKAKLHLSVAALAQGAWKHPRLVSLFYCHAPSPSCFKKSEIDLIFPWEAIVKLIYSFSLRPMKRLPILTVMNISRNMRWLNFCIKSFKVLFIMNGHVLSLRPHQVLLLGVSFACIQWGAFAPTFLRKSC